MAFLLSDSSMCVDLLRVGEQIPLLDEAMDWHHADVMDGHYCPNMALSPAWVKAFCSMAKKPVEVHLMVTRPSDWLEIFAKAGAKMIAVHAEVINANAFRTISQIRALGCKVGVVLNPATPFDYIKEYIDEIDRITIMAVDVGYSGQPMIPQTVKKIKEAADYKKAHGLSYEIQVDGCCGKSTYEIYGNAGADMFVMGSGLFGLDKDLSKAIEMMQQDLSDAEKNIKR